jgi:signal transduction histidine kinase/sugar phosphate isomerase/epimerase
MRFAFQTILWSSHDDLADALPLISRAGFTGVEIAQPPSALGNDLIEFVRRLDRHKLQLVGLAGGSLEERMRYLGDGNFRHHGEKPYLYTDDWYGDICQQALEGGYRLALHPHYPRPSTRLQYVWDLLKKHRGLEWLPDTGHLYINWADLNEAITQYPDRLAGVHLKDWTSIFGRATYCFAKGFIELGKGEVFRNFDIWRALESSHFGDKWVVVELDYPRIDVETSIHECVSWLADQKRMMRAVGAVASKADVVPSLNALMGIATRTPEHFYDSAVAYLHSQFPDSTTAIWINNDSNGECVMEAVLPKPLAKDAFWAGEWFSQLVIRTDAAHSIMIESECERNHPRYPKDRLQVYLGYGIKQLISIPVLATYNKHQVRFIIRYLLEEKCSEDPDGMLARLSPFSEAFGAAADIYISERCRRAAARARNALAGPGRLAVMLDKLAHLLKEELACQGVTVFLSDPAALLRVGGTTGIKWSGEARESPKLQVYSSDDNSVTGSVLRDERPLLNRNLKNYRKYHRMGEPKSSENVENPERASAALVPFFRSGGKLQGLIRCRNKQRSDGSIRAFTEDDLAIIDSIFRTASPLLEMQQESEHREEYNDKLFHEIATPLTALHAALTEAHLELSNLEINLSEPYLEDAFSYIDLIKRLLVNPEAELIPQPTATLLFKDVIIPAVNQIGDILKARGLSPKRLDYGGDDSFKVIPMLKIDRNMFQQVFLNLLVNAAKYVGDPRRFKIEIRPERTSRGFQIHFRDWGIGIQDRWREAIFEKGVRGEGAVQADVQGRGLGLWYVRQALGKHGGTISVTRLSDPTEFTIDLPLSLRYS